MSNVIDQGVAIGKFMRAIRALPSDEPVVTKGKWYLTQKQHWLGWLSEYGGPGAYERLLGTKRDARYAYNHIVEPRMLLWLIGSAGVQPSKVLAARKAAQAAQSMGSKSAAIRRIVTWENLQAALWPPSRSVGRRLKR